MLNLLRRAAVPAQVAIEPRFFRKALPLPEEDQRSFEVAQQLWTRLGVAYLRLTPHFPPAAKGLPLNRAVCAFRMAQYCHFQAARQCPELLDHLLFGVLAQAASNNLLRESLADPDFRHLGDSNIAGHLAWAFMLRLIDPYRLTATQLIVANRAISRWRELTSFLVAPDNDPKAKNLDLAPLFGGPLPEGVPCWLEIRSVIRKIRQRIEAMAAGESPESLKLGRELSSAACTRLLKELDNSLRSQQRETSTEIGEIEIASAASMLMPYSKAIFSTRSATGANSASLAHHGWRCSGRSGLPDADRRQETQCSRGNLEYGRLAWRYAPPIRKEAPAGALLIASSSQGTPRLGVLFGLQMTAANALTAGLHWYEEAVEAGCLKRLAPHDLRAPRCRSSCSAATMPFH